MQSIRGGDQERTIQTGREGNRSTGMFRSPATPPVYGADYGRSSALSMMRRITEDMDRLFENFGLSSPGFGLTPAFGSGLGRDLWSDASPMLERAEWTPQIETFKRGDKLVVRADLPGLRKEDVKVEIDNGVLSISGERREQHEGQRGDFYRSERSYGQFYRALTLPEGISDDQCEATFKDGVLEVALTIPKEPEKKAKQVQIR
jgi:HSP20 family protein